MGQVMQVTDGSACDQRLPCPPKCPAHQRLSSRHRRRGAQLSTCAAAQSLGHLIASMGLVLLLDMDAPVQLYQAWPQPLAYRACMLTTLR